MQDWQTLASEIVACRRCPRLVAWRAEAARIRRRAYRDQEYWGRPVPGFGDRNARLLIVGLAPAAHGANRTGRMFTGDSSGDFLYSALYRAGFANQPTSDHREDGLALHNAFVSAVCRCAPPGNKPTPDEIAACRPYLERELALLSRLQVIVALGWVAFEAMIRRSAVCGRQSFAHGAICPLGNSLPVLVASYHPSRQNTQTGRLTAAMFDQVWATARSLLQT